MDHRVNYHVHNQSRPGELDAQLTTALPAPRSSSYLREHAGAAGAGAGMLAHLFPKEAQRFTEAGRRSPGSHDSGLESISRASRGGLGERTGY